VPSEAADDVQPAAHLQPVVRLEGPWDIDDLPEGDSVARVDLGSLLLAPGTGIEVQVQADPATGKITQLTLKTSDSALQLQPYAAPRSGGMWDEIRGQIAVSITSQGGLVEEVDGSFGTEVHAMMKPGDGSSQLAPARFVGIEGPRWFLRGVFLGAAARNAGAAAALESVVRDSAVRRGNEALAVGAPMAMEIPSAAQPVTHESDTPKSIDPFERGPELSEIR
jgi:hypothetical protein